MTTVLIISSAIAIVVSFLCSLAEALLLSLSPVILHRLQGTHPKAAESWRRLKARVARPITAILVLNTTAHTGGATVAGSAFAQIYGEDKIWIFSVLFTIVVLFGTEILPKIIGVTFRKQLAPLVGPILEVITFLLSPLIALSEVMFRRLAAHGDSDQITTSDLVTLAALARSNKAINLEQENIIVNSLRLGHSNITTAMIPPERIRFLPNDATLASLQELMKQYGHTRYPVSRSSDPRDISAYIVAKKLHPASPEEFSRLMAEAKPILSVHRKASLMKGLQMMLANREHLLAVVDGKKRCIGIVTLEDIASELLGTDIEMFT